MTTRLLTLTLMVGCAVLSVGSGCIGKRNKGIDFGKIVPFQAIPSISTVESVDTVLSADLLSEPSGGEVFQRPLTSKSELPSEFIYISLDETIAFALQDVEVLRSLSANVVQNAQSAVSSLDPALQATDPNFGIHAALAAFDTNLTSSILYSNNDDTFNNASRRRPAAR